MRSRARASVAVLTVLTVFSASVERLDAQGSIRAADSVTGPLVVSSAGSLAGSMTEMLATLTKEYPGIAPRQTTGGSVDAARQAMDSATVPDVLALADVAIIPRLLVPQHATWYAAFARNAMVIAYTDRSAHASEITAGNWTDILLRPGVRSGHADPALDPGGYRARFVFQLAERHYRRKGLAARLDAAVPTVSAPAGENLVTMLERGTLDYVVVYRTTARERGLRSVELPPEVNLSDPALSATYRTASVRVTNPGNRAATELYGEPILYGVTIPRRAAHPVTARAFVRLLLSPEGQAILRQHGFTVPEHPAIQGTPPFE
jgi:molybdate/tungstate transport system substrate-binding protein